MNELPLVSVVVPTYRRKNRLINGLESVVNQSYNYLEIIVVDDNADCEWNDTIEALIGDFSKKHPEIPIEYIKNQTNLGSAETRNTGIRAASGEYVCFLDDDDLYLPNRIKNQIVPMLESNADYSITDLALYTSDDKLIEIRKREYIKDTSSESLFVYHLLHHLTGTDSLMFKKDYLLKIGGFPPINLGDEFYLMERAIKNKGRFLYVPECDIKAYVHTDNNGLSSGNGKILGENNLYEYKKQYFSQLPKKSVRYIKMRHYAVLAFAFLRSKELFAFIKNSLCSFVSSPVQCVRLLWDIIKKK